MGHTKGVQWLHSAFPKQFWNSSKEGEGAAAPPQVTEPGEPVIAVSFLCTRAHRSDERVGPTAHLPKRSNPLQPDVG